MQVHAHGSVRQAGFLRDLRTGQAFHQAQRQRFTIGIRQLLQSPDLTARLGGAAREYVRRNFLLPRHLGDYLALLAQMTA